MSAVLALKQLQNVGNFRVNSHIVGKEIKGHECSRVILNRFFFIVIHSTQRISFLFGKVVTEEVKIAAVQLHGRTSTEIWAFFVIKSQKVSVMTIF